MGSFNCSNHLFENVNERIFFAGEACSIDSVATVNGALESSERAIHKIVELKSKI
jgi:monoamine oxidase